MVGGEQRQMIVGGIGADEKYWQYLEENEFRLPACADCGRWMWPAHYRCPACGSWTFEWLPVEPIGTVFSWTRTWYSFDRTKERSGDLPYVVALVEVSGTSGSRVMGIVDGDSQGIAIGMPVRGIIQPPSEKSKGYASIHWTIEEDTR